MRSQKAALKIGRKSVSKERGTQTVEKPLRVRESQSPLELSIEPSGVYGGKQVALRPAKLNQRFRFAASRGYFIAGKSHFPERK